ncbi:MAG: Bax inhibitor-1 family protein, partial [bacterium]
MRNDTYSMAQPVSSPVVINRVLRNTYLLLSMTLLFSAAVAWYAMAANLPYPGVFVVLIGFYGLFFLTNALRNSVWGIASTFALTGFMGYTIGPIVNMYIQGFSNGDQIVMLALGMTGVVFMGMSGIALVSKKDFSFL